MAEYKKQSRAGGTYSRPFGARTSAPRELFDAECNSCRERCKVPFRPNGKKPVYCANCFVKDDSKPVRGSSHGSDTRSYPQKSFATQVPDRQIQDLKREIEAMNATLQNLVVAVDTFNRATALTLEIQKHFPAQKTPVEKVAAPKKKAAKTQKPASKK